MQIILNGTAQECTSPNIDHLLTTLELDHNKVVVELNGVIIPKEELSKTCLAANDRLELVQFVGGG
ncbi:MAG: sulfur carrier protein ThiS [Desulfovibrio sp.]|nr:sulfur carrier protein ThiS [Desulfovibrio sp.]